MNKYFCLATLGATMFSATPAILATGVTADASDPTSSPEMRSLSPQEADEIVREARQTAEQEAEAESQRLDAAPAIHRSEANLGSHKVYFNRVPVQSSSAIDATSQKTDASSKSEISDAELAKLRQQYGADKIVSAFLSCTVYDDEITEISWAHDGVAYRAFVNMNFNYIVGVGDLKVDGVRYSTAAAVGNDTREAVAERNQQAALEGWEGYTAKWLPQLSDFSGEEIEYIVVSDGSSKQDSAAFAPIDVLIQHYLDNKEALIIAHENRVVLKSARERYLEANPPQPRDTINNFAPSADSASLRK